jgi:hypothetical protein
MDPMKLHPARAPQRQEANEFHRTGSGARTWRFESASVRKSADATVKDLGFDGDLVHFERNGRIGRIQRFAELVAGNGVADGVKFGYEAMRRLAEPPEPNDPRICFSVRESIALKP